MSPEEDAMTAAAGKADTDDVEVKNDAVLSKDPVSTPDQHEKEQEEEDSKVASKNEEEQLHKYTFFVGPGNNSELVRQTFERRPWWELGKEDDPELNLKWLQVRSRSVADSVRRAGSKQFLNHLEGLTCIGRKNELYQNLKQYCEKEKINVHEIAPPTFIVAVGELCPEYAEFQRVCRQLETKVKGAIGKSILSKGSAPPDKDPKDAKPPGPPAASSPSTKPAPAPSDASSDAASGAPPTHAPPPHAPAGSAAAAGWRCGRE